jgi:purine-nucleoside phosphorylase
MTKSKFWKKLEESASCIQKSFGRETMPSTLVVLGSGFKDFAETLKNKQEIAFSDVDHFCVPSVAGHGASMIVGEADGQEVVVMTGRIHMYEGWDAQDVVYPIRVLSTIGVQNILLTNAAGSVDPKIQPGEAMVLTDHINMTGKNCLIGDAKEYGESLFIDMGNCYDKEWREQILKKEDTISGVYAGLMGPNYETTAETNMINKLGADVVGMSTVQETICAVHLKMKVAAISFVTNMAGGAQGGLHHQEVLDLATKHKQRLSDLLNHAIKFA